MKTFHQYLAESERTYDYRIKLLGDVPQEFIKNLEEKMVSKMQEIIDGIVFGVWNEVAKAKQLGKKDIIDVSFSEETDVGKLKIEVQKHCDENPESGKYITQLILPETRIRVKILEIIGKKVCAGGKKTFVVSFIDFAPHLVITEKRYREMCETEIKFSDAVMGFQQMITKEDLTEVVKMCKKFNFKGTDLHQFIIL